MAKADANCPKCKGRGYVAINRDDDVICDCLLRAKALDYLTPRYASAIFMRDLQEAILDGVDILLHRDGQQYVPSALRRAQHSIVKSYLLLTGMRYRHRTLDGLHDLVKAWVESQNYADNGGASFETLHNVDLLIINMGADPPNQHYHDLFVSLLEKRRLKGLYTWVLLPYHLDDASFRRIYRADTVRYIHEWFSIMKLHQAVDAVSKT